MRYLTKEFMGLFGMLILAFLILVLVVPRPVWRCR